MAAMAAMAVMGDGDDGGRDATVKAVVHCRGRLLEVGQALPELDLVPPGCLVPN
jgi:hypothetical protein